MPSIYEHWESGRATSGMESTRELKYVVLDASTELDALSLAASTAPATLAGFGVNRILRRKTISANPLGAGVWDVVVPYEGADNNQDQDSQRSFDTGGGTAHITQSLDTVGTYERVVIPMLPGILAPDFKGAIGVNGDSVDGVDITVPVLNFTETLRIPNEDMTREYQLSLFALTGTVNNAAFKGFAAGEVLFLGASGAIRGIEEWEIAFKFAASPNAEDIPVGDITVDSKKGWEYLWIRYEDDVDDDAKRLVKRPVAAYVEKVYRDGDFSLLGIGTA